MLPLISVIIPVYGAEAYLHQCLDSVLAQDYKPMEIILIDDGSRDRSGQICDAYARRDRRIRILHQENQGVSAARNHGVAVAKGDYIAFVDADDWLEPNYLSTLADLLWRDGSQLAFLTELPGYDGQLCGTEALRALLYQKMLDTAPWAKLISADLVHRNPFPEGMFFEDLAVVCRLFGEAERVSFRTGSLYHYRQTPDGTMNGGDVSRLLDELTAADMMYEFVCRKVPEAAQAADCRRFSAYCQVLMKLPPQGYEDQRKKIWACMKDSRSAVLHNRQARVKNKIAAAASYFGERAMRLLWGVQRT